MQATNKTQEHKNQLQFNHFKQNLSKLAERNYSVKTEKEKETITRKVMR